MVSIVSRDRGYHVFLGRLLLYGLILAETYTILLVLGADRVSGFLEALMITMVYLVGDKTNIGLTRRIRVNVAGFMAPLIFSIEILIRGFIAGIAINALSFILLLAINAFIIVLASVYVSGTGIIVDMIPPLVSSIGASILLGSLNNLGLYTYVYAFPLTFYSVIIGVDIMGIVRYKASRMVIGGKGVLDALVLYPYLVPPLTILLYMLSQ